MTKTLNITLVLKKWSSIEGQKKYQKDLAQHFGVAPNTIVNWTHSSIPLKRLVEISELIDEPVSNLLI